MKMNTLLSFVLLLTSQSFAFANTDLAQQANKENQIQQKQNQVREREFTEAERELSALKQKLSEQKRLLEEQNAQLSSLFSDNEVTLSHLEEELRVESGSLGELFGVVRQHAKELKADLNESFTAIGEQKKIESIDRIVAAQTLPDIHQLKNLWLVMQQQVLASGQVTTLDVDVIDQQGEAQSTPALRIGNFALLTHQGYVQWHSDKQFATPYTALPSQTPTMKQLTEMSSNMANVVLLDPTRGVLLEQFANAPTLGERFAAGGAVGKVIVGLLLIGLIIALYRGAMLLVTKRKINVQLKAPAQLGDNPLGRILSVYSKEKPRSVEALELRLLEAIVDEQTGLEKGLSMLKLLAALAPMLGLLGTVIGMIETFQVITQFGNGDPKVMANGISMALVTTVLGLVAAMPLLLAHNVLSSLAEEIRNTLEKQGIGLVAQQAERKTQTESLTVEKVGNAA
ncbi:MotA/TolQ/ExbB proton channel family protein [Vibrio sp. IRLE0018]|uniref:MotA/TolQ/ExbB proton channel family protein n=1 Tax=Vibrio floridensis TaxID=2908007 RepID=UPI001F19511B|nr:MotA/TolQ/ExbB proton channel family protein [Vibrio floridensis]MCF8777834.1 MotA/TolQ/ExbB proton channel family protein [Vibrio floridensis]